MQVGVVGHIEWVRFARVPELPEPGAILHAKQTWEEPAGGGAVAAVELARLAGSSVLFTAVGSDRPGADACALLEARGVTVRAARREEPQRQATTLIGPEGDRSIIVHGSALFPTAADFRGFDSFAALDGLYVCQADAPLVQLARQARIVVATARILPVLREAAVVVDALVHSCHDAREAYRPGDLSPPPRAVVSTEGASGGSYQSQSGAQGRWQAEPLPGPLRDTYGAGDCFAAGLCHALAAGATLAEAVRFGATRGALALTRSGAHGALP